MAIERFVKSIVKFKNETVAYWDLDESLKGAKFYIESLYPTVIIKGYEGLSKEEILKQLNLKSWQEFLDKMEEVRK